MALFIVSGCNSQTVKNTDNMKNSTNPNRQIDIDIANLINESKIPQMIELCLLEKTGEDKNLSFQHHSSTHILVKFGQAQQYNSFRSLFGESPSASLNI